MGKRNSVTVWDMMMLKENKYMEPTRSITQVCNFFLSTLEMDHISLPNTNIYFSFFKNSYEKL